MTKPTQDSFADRYRDFVAHTARYPQANAHSDDIFHKQEDGTFLPIYSSLGLSNEVGEYLGKIKKIIRGDKPFDDAAKEAMAQELGDVLWYLQDCIARLKPGMTIADLMGLNMAKLKSRLERGVLQGDGDNR